MSAALPIGTSCCTPCDDPVTVQTPGPQGDPGTDGTNGTDGANAFTALTVAFTMPAEAASSTATVADTSWMIVNQIVFVQTLGYMKVTAVNSGVSVDLQNVEDTATGAYADNAAPGTIAPIAASVAPGGLQGPGATASGAAGGDLKGTYPNPRISVANTKGSLIAGDGTNSTAVAAGTNGFVLAADSTAGNGIAWKHSLPVTGDAVLADNRLPRLDGATGTPVPLQSSKMTLTDNGALQSDGSGGNARGADAVDLQVVRGAVGQVASGAAAVLSGGQNNTASGAQSTVGGGDSNTASGADSTVAGGINGAASALYSTVGGGNANTASSRGSVVGGGESNSATTNNRITIGGGQANTATGQESTIGGGQSNIASGTQSTIGGGDSNQTTGQESTVSGGVTSIASGAQSTIGGGQDNRASGTASTIPGGKSASASHYAEVAHAAGVFASIGDSQVSELLWRIATTDATPTEIFLDGAGFRATIPATSTWAFDIIIVGRSSAGVAAAWQVKGAIQNNAGTTALVAAVTNSLLADGTGGTWGAIGNVPVVSADNVNDSLLITVVGSAATLIRWTAHARIVQVQY